MARFYGNIGFGLTEETEPGVWTPKIISRPYYGDILRKFNKWNQSENPNDDLALNNEISIVADQFAYENASCVKWVEMYGTKWKVTSIEIDHPRMKLTFGGVWNGD